MFDVRGSKIYYEGHPFAKIEGAPWPGLAIDAENALLAYEDQADMIDVDDHAKQLAEAEKDSYDSGYEQGKTDGMKDCETENRETWETAAFEEGRADAAVSADRAAQVERVDALLLALKTAHDALHAPVTKRYPTAKIKECKDAMRGAMSTLRFALNDYNAPNGA